MKKFWILLALAGCVPSTEALYERPSPGCACERSGDKKCRCNHCQSDGKAGTRCYCAEKDSDCTCGTRRVGCDCRHCTGMNGGGKCTCPK
jgi:hypothetical protein